MKANESPNTNRSQPGRSPAQREAGTKKSPSWSREGSVLKLLPAGYEEDEEELEELDSAPQAIFSQWPVVVLQNGPERIFPIDLDWTATNVVRYSSLYSTFLIHRLLTFEKLF